MQRILRLTALVVAVAAFAQPARAAFTLEIRNNLTDSVYNTTIAGSSFTLSGVNLDGYLFNGTVVTSNKTTGEFFASVAFAGQVTKTAGAENLAVFSYSVKDSPFDFPGLASGAVSLTAHLTSDYSPDSSESWLAGTTVKTTAKLANNATPPGSYAVTTKLINGAGQTREAGITADPRGPEYVLENSGTITFTGSGLGTVKFSSEAVVAAPEPAAVLIGIAGVPCMGLVVLMARRRARASVVGV